MGKMGELYAEMHPANEDDYFQLMSQEEFETEMHRKYGHGATYRLMLENGEKPNINDLDNLFNCAEDGKS